MYMTCAAPRSSGKALAVPMSRVSWSALLINGLPVFDLLHLVTDVRLWDGYTPVYTKG
jgi:hypothetical protein